MFAYKSIYFDKPFINGRVMDIFIPKKIEQKQALYFIHGGGWAMGSRLNLHTLIEQFLKLGFICAASDYRLSEINAFDQVTDLRHGYDLLVSELKYLGRPLEIIVYGSSAGAHLGLLLTLTKPGGLGEEIEAGTFKLQNPWVQPQGGIFQAAPTYFAPWEDIFPGIERPMRKIAGASFNDNPAVYQRLSPINYINNKSCAIFFMHAENEHNFPFWHVKNFKDKMEREKRYCQIITYSTAEHGFFYDITRRVQKEAFADFIEFVKII